MRILPFALLGATVLLAQIPPVKPPPGFGPNVVDLPKPEATPPPAAAQPARPAQPAAPAPAAPAAPPSAPMTASLGGLNLQNAALTEVIDILARQLKINYILDPRVKGGVVLNTYGETKQLSPRDLLDMILRINGFAMVQVGEVYRIVPMSDAARLPIKAGVNAKDLPDNESVQLNLIFLKYANVDELTKLLEPFTGENSKMWSYPPANLLLLMDGSRSMRRTMELISLFDNDTFASQRVKLFEVENGRPSELSKELETIFKSISLNEKSSPLKFLPVDRINTIIVVAANPSAFSEVETWLKKLDVPAQITAGSIDNYVYRVKYGRADMMSMAIMMLYSADGGMGMGMMGMMAMMSMMGGGMGGGMGMGGMGMGGMGMGGMGMGGMGMGGMGMGMGGMGMGGMGMGFPMMNPSLPLNPQQAAAMGTGAVGSTDRTGTYLGAGAAGTQPVSKGPRVVPNPMDNTIIIQGTPAEYEGILKILKQLDIPPRQVLIEAKIYEVSLTGAFANGIAAFLQKKQTAGGTTRQAGSRDFVGSLASGALNLSAGALVGQSRELLAFLSSAENEARTRVISAPSMIATDSIAASINVGTEVPTLTAQAATGVQSGGSSLFANNISNRNSGVTMNITARVNPSGIVTMLINQEVSAPIAPAAGAINSPSFSKRTLNTQVTVEDGDTIAIGGIINETNTQSSAGIPVLHRIPILGWGFGSKSFSKERTELIVFMTPRVIFDTKEITEASEELKSRMRRLRKIVKE
ncbi:MAG: type II secretion system secretin GspD [Acidobacteriaceae bacterium]|nr:type II secretion system secretin GspD [Acidobacteriaceae bacterium]